MTAELGGLDLLVFTGGIGERSPTVRQEICRGLAHLGLDAAAEEAAASSSVGRARVRVVPTNENLMIARQTWHVLYA